MSTASDVAGVTRIRPVFLGLCLFFVLCTGVMTPAGRVTFNIFVQSLCMFSALVLFFVPIWTAPLALYLEGFTLCLCLIVVLRFIAEILQLQV